MKSRYPDEAFRGRDRTTDRERSATRAQATLCALDGETDAEFAARVQVAAQSLVEAVRRLREKSAPKYRICWTPNRRSATVNVYTYGG